MCAHSAGSGWIDYGAECFWERYIAFETKCAGDDYSRVFMAAVAAARRSLDAMWLRFRQLTVEKSGRQGRADLQQQLEAAGPRSLPLHGC